VVLSQATRLRYSSKFSNVKRLRLACGLLIPKLEVLEVVMKRTLHTLLAKSAIPALAAVVLLVGPN